MARKKQIEVTEDDIWMYDCKLNQTNIGNNNNKFYLLKVFKEGNIYYRRAVYGRVGNSGVTKDLNFGTLDKAVDAFKKQFFAKTKNKWEDRHSFVAKSGKYTLVKLAENEEVEEQDEEEKPKVKRVEAPSKLDKGIQYFINLIGNQQMIKEQMEAFHLDSKKLPLGKIDSKQVEKGHEILQRIKDTIEGNTTFDLEDLANEFYSNIPHAFGRMRPPLIDTNAKVKEKVEMLTTLQKIEDVQTLLKEAEEEEEIKNPKDRIFESLNIDLQEVPASSEEFAIVDEYVSTGAGPTHFFKAKLDKLYRISKREEEERFKEWENNHNRQLLWHGSRMANWMSILKNGLNINPPKGVVITGKMFGGSSIYTANICTKSAQYCDAFSSHGKGVMVLLEVALGNTYDLNQAENVTLASLKSKNKDSTWGQGVWTPNPKNAKTLQNGCFVPIGPPIKKKNFSTALRYDEFIVYRMSQFKMKYVVVLDIS